MTYTHTATLCASCGLLYVPALIDHESRLCAACASEVEAATAFALVRDDAVQVLGEEEARRILGG